RQACGQLWQEALANLDRLNKRASLERSATSPVFTDEAWDELLSLAKDLRTLWSCPTTEDRDRKEILRSLVSRVVVEEKREGFVRLTIHGADGGRQTRLEVNLPTPYAGRRIRELTGLSPRDIAAKLNEEGLRTQKGKLWSAPVVLARLPEAV